MSTGVAGSNAAASITNQGDNNFLLNMIIPRGNDGIAPIFSTSTSTSTLSAGSSATASISGSGTSSNPYIFSFGIPEGRTGSSGPADTSVPTGTICAFGGNSTPSDWLLCDGAAVSRTTYVALFNVIGTTYGAGDGSTTFNLPLLTDSRYLQGDTTAGTRVSAGLPNITGNITNVSSVNRVCAFGANTATSGAFSKYSLGSTGDNVNNTGGNYAQYGLQIKASLSNSIYGSSTTVIPKSLTIRYMIKY